MKKLIAFTTALLMLSTVSSFAVFADEAPDAEAVITAEEVTETVTPDAVEAEDTSEAEETEKKEESGWQIVCNKAADAELQIAEDVKEYLVFIKNPGGAARGGVDKWDIQFKTRGLSIEKDHEYTLTYRISASYAGNYYTKISNYDSATVGDAVAGEVWHNQLGISTMKSYVSGVIKDNQTTNYSDAWSLQSIDKGDTINVTCNFTAIESIPEAEWAFFLGGAGDTTPYDCFAAGTELRFTNLTLTDNTTGQKLVDSYSFINSDVKGDINADGVADMSDLTTLCLAMLGDEVLDDSQLTNADVNQDGAFNLADLAHFKRFVSGLTDSL